jgi:dUTPase
LIQATELPTIIKQAMKIYQPTKKTEEEKKEEEKAKKKKKKGGHGHGGILHLNQI